MIEKLIHLADYLDCRGFKKEADIIGKILNKYAMNTYNSMGLVDLNGEFHSTEGLSHPDWTHNNRDIVGFVPRIKDEDDDPDSDVYFDDGGNIALDVFMYQGWIRVKPNNGIQLDGLHAGNISLVKSIMRDIAKDNPGRTLYIDDGNGTKYISVDMRGRPDFSEIETFTNINNAGEQMIEKLIALADRLDIKGLKKEANFIDSLIKKFAQEMENEDGGQCDFEVDECHNCWAICGETDWLCRLCKQLAQKMGLTDKQLAYDNMSLSNDFENEDLSEMLKSDKPIVEDFSGDSDNDMIEPGSN